MFYPTNCINTIKTQFKCPIPDVYSAERLGHDIDTLKRIYQHLDIDKNKEIDDIVISLLDKKRRYKLMCAAEVRYLPINTINYLSMLRKMKPL